LRCAVWVGGEAALVEAIDARSLLTKLLALRVHAEAYLRLRNAVHSGLLIHPGLLRLRNTSLSSQAHQVQHRALNRVIAVELCQKLSSYSFQIRLSLTRLLWACKPLHLHARIHASHPISLLCLYLCLCLCSSVDFGSGGGRLGDLASVAMCSVRVVDVIALLASPAAVIRQVWFGYLAAVAHHTVEEVNIVAR